MSREGEPEVRLLEIGKVVKPHGLRGDVVVSLSTNVAGRLATGAVLHAGERSLTVVRSAPHQQKFIVHFDGVDSKEAADELHGVLLHAEAVTDEDPDALWIHELIGRRVIDQEGIDRGEVVSVIDNPASDLLELDSGALVPLRFVTDHADAATLTVDVPEGLFEPEP